MKSWLLQQGEVYPASIGQSRELLAECMLKLHEHAFMLDFRIRPGEILRDPRIAQMNAVLGKGISNSLHLIGLAYDINLFKGGDFLTETDDHLPLGIFWEGLHKLCRWGGRFNDGNHYSIAWQGRK